jgi:hypothetical protein
MKITYQPAPANDIGDDIQCWTDTHHQFRPRHLHAPEHTTTFSIHAIDRDRTTLIIDLDRDEARDLRDALISTLNQKPEPKPCAKHATPSKHPRK